MLHVSETAVRSARAAMQASLEGLLDAEASGRWRDGDMGYGTYRPLAVRPNLLRLSVCVSAGSAAAGGASEAAAGPPGSALPAHRAPAGRRTGSGRHSRAAHCLQVRPTLSLRSGDSLSLSRNRGGVGVCMCVYVCVVVSG